MMSLVALLVAMAIPTVPAFAGNGFDIAKAMTGKTASFELPFEDVSVAHVSGNITVVVGEQEFVVTQTVVGNKFSYTAVPTSSGMVVSVFGTLGILPNGVQVFEYNIDLGDNVIVAGAIGGVSMPAPGGTVVVLMQPCDCHDGVTFGCTTTMCTNGTKCDALTASTCFWVGGGPPPGPPPTPAPKPKPKPQAED